jgi:hypothetical protein
MKGELYSNFLYSLHELLALQLQLIKLFSDYREECSLEIDKLF